MSVVDTEDRGRAGREHRSGDLFDPDWTPDSVVADDVLRTMLGQLALLPDRDQRRTVLRERVIHGYLPVALLLARRFRRPGVRHADLIKVAVHSLVTVVDRYDPRLERDFLKLAVPAVVDALREHYRDVSGMLPERYAVLQNKLRDSAVQLAGELGRSPRPSELADRLGVTVEELCDVVQLSPALCLRHSRRRS
jgi:RNA polymerase sigma-B factor